ncbi:type II toxin-antitoxin system RelE/ParE family toxin [Streptomyces sp. NPDC056161]|uniref:type II toxin-antitoxin system RelE/ParE family toxin n=1 Tax=Streptomyces sp. NPDC056161 TaxID=3345732 RepID=UPI0035D78D0A
MTSEVRDWLHRLRKDDRDIARLVGQAIQALVEEGPGLGRPLVDRIKGAEVHNLKELRPGLAGASEVRMLFAFDPRRNAVRLVAGDKAGQWSGWYRWAIPAAEARCAEWLDHLARTAGGGRGVTGLHAWDDVKHEVFDAEDLDAIDAGAQRMVAEARARRLAEMRRQLGLTQREVAARMHVRQERVSAIERGNAAAAEVRTIAAYIAALGGQLEIVANFNDTRVTVA